MRIQILSDLHLEIGQSDAISFDRADVVVLAGDIHQSTQSIAWIKRHIPDKPVIYVLGNHEYYKGAYPKTLYQIQQAAKSTNIQVLENTFFDIADVRFHGATLWTDFSIFGDPRDYGILCQDMMNDYRYIKQSLSYSKLRTINTYQIHQVSKTWLAESLSASTDRRNIVITHHAPSLKSIPMHQKNQAVVAAYVSNLEAFILDHRPLYWVHGHTHWATRYLIGDTEVICNPHGYIDAPRGGFNPALIIDV